MRLNSSITGFLIIYSELDFRVGERKPGVMLKTKRSASFRVVGSSNSSSSRFSKRRRVKLCRLIAVGETSPHKTIEEIDEASAMLLLATRIRIFNLLVDLLDFCAVEKTSRVSKAGIVDVHKIAS